MNKVYVLTQVYYEEQGSVLGVYSSKELCETKNPSLKFEWSSSENIVGYANRTRKSDDYWYEVWEIELDA